MDVTQIILAAITAITTIALAYIAARWHITRQNGKGKKDNGNTPKD